MFDEKMSPSEYPPGGMILQDNKLVKASGGFSPAGSTTVFPCPAGKYTIKNGLQYQSECSLCPPGLFCPQGEFKACPFGTTSLPGSSTGLVL